MRHKKTLLAILMIIVMLASLFALIACNNNNDNDNDDANENTNLSELENQFNSVIAYGTNNYSSCDINTYFTKDAAAEEYGEGFKWLLGSGFQNNNDAEEKYLYIYQYDTEENAKTALAKFESAAESLKREGNMLIHSEIPDIYDTVKAAVLSDSIKKSTVYSSGIKELRSKNNIADLTDFELYYSYYNNYSDENIQNATWATFEITTSPNGSNCEETFYCSTQDPGDEDIEKEIGTEYTSDSYVKFENEIYTYRLKRKPGFRYELTEDGNGYAITAYYYESTDGTLNVPSEIDGKPVTEIKGLYLEKEITHVILPNSITKIGTQAFQGCQGLQSILIPSSVTEIGYRAIPECFVLHTINCEAPSKPDGWDNNWNDSYNADVVWGYKG